MHDFLLIGTIIGLVLGLMHTLYLTRLFTTGSDSAVTPGWPSILNFCGWTLLLWLLMGAYVLGFWFVGCVFYLVFKAFRQ
jgi:hypothetical protein